jgi:hypothetical protein
MEVRGPVNTLCYMGCLWILNDARRRRILDKIPVQVPFGTSEQLIDCILQQRRQQQHLVALLQLFL